MPSTPVAITTSDPIDCLATCSQALGTHVTNSGMQPEASAENSREQKFLEKAAKELSTFVLRGFNRPIVSLNRRRATGRGNLSGVLHDQH